MAEKIEKGVDLEKALDESLAELAKAAQGEEQDAKGEEKDEEDAKGDEKKEDEDAKGEKPAFLKKKGDKKDEDEDEDEDKKKKESEDAKGDEKKEDEDMKDEKKEDEDEKSMREGHKSAAKDSLTKSETVSNAIEVSKFLREVVKSLADSNGDLSYRVRALEKSINAIGAALVKSQTAQNDIIKSFGSDVEKMGKAPLPRKGVDARSIEKSFRGEGDAASTSTLSKSQIAEKLCNLEIEGKVPYNTTTKFEATGELSKSFEKLVHESK